MKNFKYLTNKSDFFGVLTCSLCLIHCISTPLIIISFSSIQSELSMTYSWWKNFDYVLILISFFMVYISTQITKVVSMKYLFWFSWGTLFLLIINEKTDSFKFSEYITYIATSLLAFLHLFNLKYCK